MLDIIPVHCVEHGSWVGIVEYEIVKTRNVENSSVLYATHALQLFFSLFSNSSVVVIPLNVFVTVTVTFSLSVSFCFFQCNQRQTVNRECIFFFLIRTIVQPSWILNYDLNTIHEVYVYFTYMLTIHFQQWWMVVELIIKTIFE